MSNTDTTMRKQTQITYTIFCTSSKKKKLRKFERYQRSNLKKKTHEKTNVYIYQTTKTVLKSNENKRRNKIINVDREANIYSNDRALSWAGTATFTLTVPKRTS